MSRNNRQPAEPAQYATAVDVFPSEGGHLPFAEGNPCPAPTDAERALMAPLGIQFDGRAFCFAGSRYDRLADAVSNARRANTTDRH